MGSYKSEELKEKFESETFGNNAPRTNLGRIGKLVKYKHDYENNPLTRSFKINTHRNSSVYYI